MRTFCFISQRGCPNLVPEREPRHGYREYPICNCVHSYSISPCQTPFFKNMSFATITKPWTLTELVTVCTQGPGVHFCTRVQVLDLVLGHRAMFKKLRFGECLILIWVISGPLLGFCNGEGALSRVLKGRALKGGVGVSVTFCGAVVSVKVMDQNFNDTR